MTMYRHIDPNQLNSILLVINKDAAWKLYTVNRLGYPGWLRLDTRMSQSWADRNRVRCNA